MAAEPNLVPALVAAVRRLDVMELAKNAAGALMNLASAGARERCDVETCCLAPHF